VEDVRDRRGEVLVRLHDPGGEAVAEEVAAACVAAVEALGVDAVEPAHAGGEVGAAGFDDQVVVVAHEAERLARPVVGADRAREHREEEQPVGAVAVDRQPVHAAARQVPPAVGGKDPPRSSRHGGHGRARGPPIEPG
jgi:hypothetical protein